jgi:hypothetical protein
MQYTGVGMINGRVLCWINSIFAGFAETTVVGVQDALRSIIGLLVNV